MKDWVYDEFKHCGVDYSKAEEAEKYDQQHQKFRDYKREFAEMMAFLDLGETQSKSLIDLGCGTGAIAVLAAERFKVVYAVDVSEVMLRTAERKFQKKPQNLQFICGGFLSYQHQGEPADVVVTKAALHHLPDFWKQAALLRINRMLKAGGALYIHDVVFQFEPETYADRTEAWIGGFEKIAGAEFRREVETHIRDEHSTYGWILAGMLERAGFKVEQCRTADGFVSEYACHKTRDILVR